MANVDRPNGFRPAKSLLGVPWSHLIRRYVAADRSSDTTNGHGHIGIGDPVTLSSGLVVPANSGAAVLGVCVGVGRQPAGMHGEVGPFNPDNLTKLYADLADATGVVIYVVPAEGVLFEVQSASDLDLTLGALADHSLVAGTAHMSTSTGLSTVELVAASDNDVRVVEFVTTVDNDTTLANARYLVQFVDTVNTL